MYSGRTNCVLVAAALVLTSLLATSVQASLIGVFEQVSPTPTTYVQAVGGIAEDPAPPGSDFATFQDFLGAPSNTAFGAATANIQYVPGLGDDPQDFIDAGFVAGNIALIDRGAVNFTTKIINAAGAGAVGALIANTTPSGAGGLFEGGMPDMTTIPALMLRFGLGQDFIADLNGGATIQVNMSVTEPPRDPAVELGPGIWDTRIIAIDDQNGAADHDINDAFEAVTILAFADGDPVPDNGWNIRYDVSDNRNVIDMAGGFGTFPSNHPYPNGESEPDNSPGVGEDFLVQALTTVPMLIPEGDWTIAFGSDDGGILRMLDPGFSFTNKINADSIPGFDNGIAFSGTRGHSWTAGEFTVGPGGLAVAIEAVMFERGGGDSFEIAISAGHNGNSVVNDTTTWHILADGTLGWTAIPEPSTLVLGLIGLVGLLAVGLRRRKAA